MTRGLKSCNSNWLKVRLEIFWICFWRNPDKKFIRQVVTSVILKRRKKGVKNGGSQIHIELLMSRWTGGIKLFLTYLEIQLELLDLVLYYLTDRYRSNIPLGGRDKDDLCLLLVNTILSDLVASEAASDSIWPWMMRMIWATHWRSSMNWEANW